MRGNIPQLCKLNEIQFSVESAFIQLDFKSVLNTVKKKKWHNIEKSWKILIKIHATQNSLFHLFTQVFMFY